MNTLRHSILLLIFFVGGLPCITVAQFVPNDEVELLRDEPLLFNTSVYRQGKKGERFRVAAYRADLHKVFILATDAKGKSFALSVPDAAVAPVGKDVGMLNDQAFAALRTGKLEEAQKLMLQVSVLDRERSVCAEIATHLGRVSTAQLAYQQGLKQQVQTQVEVQRKFRNAAVTDTPNPLNANDNSGRTRAEQMRKDAEQLEANAKTAIESKQEQITSELKLLSELAQKREKDGAYGEASDIGEMVAALASRQPGGSDLSGDLGRRQELKKKAADAQKHIEDARRNVAAKRLSAALKSVEVGLSVEPGSYSLRRLQGEISQRVEVSTKAYATAVAHQQLKHYEEALKALEQARMECTDHEPSETLAATLRKTIAEKGERIAKAKTAEAAGDFATAFEVYETYAMDSDAKKILPQYAKQRETAGDFLLAYSLYEKAGLPVEMQRVQIKKEQQQAEMQKQADANAQKAKTVASSADKPPYDFTFGHFPFGFEKEDVLSMVEKRPGIDKTRVIRGVVTPSGLYENIKVIGDTFAKGLYSHRTLPPQSNTHLSLHPNLGNSVVYLLSPIPDAPDDAPTLGAYRLYFYRTSPSNNRYFLFGATKSYTSKSISPKNHTNSFDSVRKLIAVEVGGEPVIIDNTAQQDKGLKNSKTAVWDLPTYWVWFVMRKSDQDLSGFDKDKLSVWDSWTIGYIDKLGVNQYLASLSSVNTPTQDDFDMASVMALVGLSGKTEQQISTDADRLLRSVQRLRKEEGANAQQSGTSSPPKQAPPEAPQGPPDDVIIKGARILNEKLVARSHRLGQTLVSRGLKGIPRGTLIYPVKFDDFPITVYYTKDEFGDWKVFTDSLDPIPCGPAGK
jgi:hypothetical protein